MTQEICPIILGLKSMGYNMINDLFTEIRRTKENS